MQLGHYLLRPSTAERTWTDVDTALDWLAKMHAEHPPAAAPTAPAAPEPKLLIAEGDTPDQQAAQRRIHDVTLRAAARLAEIGPTGSYVDPADTRDAERAQLLGGSDVYRQYYTGGAGMAAYGVICCPHAHLPTACPFRPS